MLTIATYSLVYLVTCLIVLLAVGLCNRILRRPFFDGWRYRLVLVTTLYFGFLVADPLLRMVGFTGSHK